MLKNKRLPASLFVLVLLAACGGADQETSGKEDPLLSSRAAASERISNGDFENGLTGWTLGGAKSPIASTAHPHAGGTALRLGATTGSGTAQPNGDSFAYQTVAIPANAAQATLSFWYYAQSLDTPANDWQEAQVRDASGTPLIDLFHFTDNSQLWTQRTVDLTAFAGQSVQVWFNAHGNGGTVPTTLWVDDVSLAVTAAPVALQNGVAVTGLAGARSSSSTFTLAVPAGATGLTFALGTGTSSSNDADLYVKFGAPPTTGSYDCSSIKTGLTDSCSIASPKAGTYYVLVYGYTAYSGAALKGSFTAPVGGDTTPPTTSVTAPAAGATVSGTVTVSATGSDNVGVVKLELYADSTLIGSCPAATCSVSWNSGSVANGAHTVDSKAYDAAGNSTVSTLIHVTVSNGSGGGGTLGASISVHTTLGLPDGATTSTANPNHYLSVKPEYVISYDSALKVPNWSSWELNSSWLGSASRANDFRPDDTLPASLPQAQLTDYSGSGYDRGHMCPSADRTANTTDNESTFYLSNMVPQAHNSNAGPWEKLEVYERSLATAGKELFVVAGPIFGTSHTIGAGVAVPDSTWKVVVVLDAPGQGVANVSSSTRVIAVIMPNDNSVISLSDDWKPYRVTVRQIEAATGLNLLADVPQGIQNVIETQVDTQ